MKGLRALEDALRAAHKRIVLADKVIMLSQLCCVTTGEQGQRYQAALDEYKRRWVK